MDEAVHVPGFFFSNVSPDIKTLDLTCEFARKTARVKLCDVVNTRPARQQVIPRLCNAVAHRADAAQTRHNDTTTTHCLILKKT